MAKFNLTTTTLQSVPRSARVRRVLQAALDAVDPAEAVRRFLRMENTHILVIGRDEAARRYDLRDYDHIYLVGAGKASVPMALAAAGVLGSHLTEGAVVAKAGFLEPGSENTPPNPDPMLVFYEGAHPVPDESSVEATGRVLELVSQAGENDLVLCLLSGGGSALLTRPAEGLTLNNLQQLTRDLLASGANIEQINAVRKHLDLVKGGGLAQAAMPAAVATLILSDVVGDSLDVIASGPTVADASTYQDAWNVLEQYHLLGKAPEQIQLRIAAGRSGQLDETPKPGYQLFERVQNVIIGSNRLAANAALSQARLEGFEPLLLSTYLQGEASQAGRLLAAVLRQIADTGEPVARPACIVIGGETTVTLRGNGLGGRNQELALGSVQELAGVEQVLLVTLATDGDDGPTDAAGAVVTGETLARAAQAGLDPQKFLANNDAYHFFNALGDLLKPGPTQTNVNDLAFLFAF
jgi:hydroxypyruvate reductase